MTLSKLLCAYESELGFVCDRKRCTRTATHIVVWHVLDQCTEFPCGDRVFIMCAPCAKDTVKRYREKVDRMKYALRQRDSRLRLECTSCGKVVGRLADVCRMESLLFQSGKVEKR